MSSNNLNLAHECAVDSIPSQNSSKLCKITIDNICERINNYVKKANRNGNFGLRISSKDTPFLFEIKAPDIHHGDSMSGWKDDPIRKVTLFVKYDSFIVHFSWFTFEPNPRYSVDKYNRHFAERDIFIKDVDDAYISFLVKWVATGEPKIKDMFKRGFFRRLFS